MPEMRAWLEAASAEPRWSSFVTPVVHATFPLREAAEAHRIMESSAHIGKLVLVV